MKIVTMSKIGYNHPSQANWSWGVWKIDLINTNDVYCRSYVVKEQFGGDSRLKSKVSAIIETKGVYTGTGTQKITGINKIMNMESEELYKEIDAFLA